MHCVRRSQSDGRTLLTPGRSAPEVPAPSVAVVMAQEAVAVAVAEGQVMGWRDEYKVHPAADVFPMMSDEELDALAKDIEENGLREPIKIMRVGKAKQIAENA